jgi:hypothetical protein
MPLVPCECVSLGCRTKVKRGQMAAHLAQPGHQELTLQMVLGMKAQLALTVVPGSEVIWNVPNTAAEMAANDPQGITSGRHALYSDSDSDQDYEIHSGQFSQSPWYGSPRSNRQ